MPRTYSFRNPNAEVLRWHPELREGELESDYFELIWNDIHLQEGYQIGLGFFARPPAYYERVDRWKEEWEGHRERSNWPAVELHIAGPDEKMHTAVKSFPPESFQPKPWGVTLGDNAFDGILTPKGMPDSYHIRTALGDIGVDLEAKVIAGGVRFVEDEHGYSYYNPVKNRALGWWPLVGRSEVSGTITVEGRPVKVSGLAYCERQLGNLPSSTQSGQAWHFWGHFFAGEYSAVWTDSASSEHFNYRHFTPLVLWKGNEVLLSTFQSACYAERFGPDSDGVPYPTVESLKASDGITELTAQLVNGKLISRMGAYHRQYSEAHVQIKRWGETTEVSGSSTHEWNCAPEWFPGVFDKTFRSGV